MPLNVQVGGLVTWPPEAGWIQRVVGKEIYAEAAAAFVDRD